MKQRLTCVENRYAHQTKKTYIVDIGDQQYDDGTVRQTNYERSYDQRVGFAPAEVNDSLAGSHPLKPDERQGL